MALNSLQAGVAYAANGLSGLTFIAWLLAVCIPPLFLATWYLPEPIQFTYDTIQGRDLLAESERERQFDGRPFDPKYHPQKKKTE